AAPPARAGSPLPGGAQGLDLEFEVEGIDEVDLEERLRKAGLNREQLQLVFQERVHEAAQQEPHLNHVTTPIGPSFLHQERASPWIYQRRAEEERQRLESEERELQRRGFRARPVPATLLAPRPWQITQSQLPGAARRSRSAEGARGSAGAAERAPSAERSLSAERSRPGSAHGPRERRSSPRFDLSTPEKVHQAQPRRARPVPWSCTAPLYDQMLAEKERLRAERSERHVRQRMRSSSLPPRLEAVRATIAGEAAGHGRVHRASTPVPAAQLASGAAPRKFVVGRAHRAERKLEAAPGPGRGGARAVTDAAEGMARAASASVLLGAGGGPSSTLRGALGHSALSEGGPASPLGQLEGLAAQAGRTGVYGRSYGLSHFSPPERPATGGRAEAAPDHRSVGQPTISREVPDFAALHEREKQMLERRKSRNRQLTRQAPFVFHVPRPARSTVRQPKLAKDPSSDWRFSRPRSAGAPRAGSAGPSWRQALERPTAAPPRSTEKALQWQHHTRRYLQELAEREQRAQEAKEPPATKASPEMRRRVQEAAAAAGPVEPLQERISRIVADKRQDSALLHRKKRE
ncbi:unnamed protein product, partial [Prorocentrum cordatum]